MCRKLNTNLQVKIKLKAIKILKGYFINYMIISIYNPKEMVDEPNKKVIKKKQFRIITQNISL